MPRAYGSIPAIGPTGPSGSPGIVEASLALKARSFILDAELVADSFYDIPSAIKQRAGVGHGVRHPAPQWYRPAPASSRGAQKRLAKLIGAGDPCLQISEVFDDGEKLLEAAAKHGLEGVVSKRKDSAYRSERCLHWLKVKTATWRAANKERYKLFERKVR
jgi:ATP-dependent DNA ligase